jgi:hypothetical protein
MKRTLTLTSETLRELSSDELGDVAGAAGALPTGLSCPLTDCFVESRLGTCYSWAC